MFNYNELIIVPIEDKKPPNIKILSVGSLVPKTTAFKDTNNLYKVLIYLFIMKVEGIDWTLYFVIEVR